MEIYSLERNLLHHVGGHQDHPSHPEEEDIISRFHHLGWVEFLIIWALL